MSSDYTPGPSAGGSGTVTSAVRLIAYGTPAAASYDGVHAVVAATDANAFPGPFTDPDIPRVLQVQVSDAAAWDGGAITVTGTDWTGAVISEVFTPSGIDAPQNIVGVKPFATVTGASKAAVGASAATASIGRENALGVSIAGTVGTEAFAWKGAFPMAQAVTVDTVNKTVSMTVDGANPYRVMIEVTP